MGKFDRLNGVQLSDLTDDDWKLIFLSLLDYSRYKKKFSFDIYDPDDIATEAIKRLYEKRTINLDKHNNVYNQLVSIVDSIYYDDYKKYKNRKKLFDKKFEKPKDDNSCIENCDNDYNEEHLKLLRIFAESDEDIGLVVLALEEGCETYPEIRKELGWDDSTLDNVKKRIRRRYEKLRLKNEK